LPYKKNHLWGKILYRSLNPSKNGVKPFLLPRERFPREAKKVTARLIIKFFGTKIKTCAKNRICFQIMNFSKKKFDKNIKSVDQIPSDFLRNIYG